MKDVFNKIKDWLLKIHLTYMVFFYLQQTYYYICAHTSMHAVVYICNLYVITYIYVLISLNKCIFKSSLQLYA